MLEAGFRERGFYSPQWTRLLSRTANALPHVTRPSETVHGLLTMVILFQFLQVGTERDDLVFSTGRLSPLQHVADVADLSQDEIGFVVVTLERVGAGSSCWWIVDLQLPAFDQQRSPLWSEHGTRPTYPALWLSLAIANKKRFVRELRAQIWGRSLKKETLHCKW